MGIPFTRRKGFLLTATMGFLFTMTLGIQLTISTRATTCLTNNSSFSGTLRLCL
jgi:hypothetical protein